MSKEFLGRGWKFPIEVDEATGRIKQSEHEDNIAEAIRTIIWTSKGERLMRPDFGCGIDRYLFETNDDTTLRLVEAEVEEAIRMWEPRVHEIEVLAERDANDESKLLLHVKYEVRTTNNLFNQVYPFYLYEGSN
ncbi:GPW/gp25 family protein [Paenibacillus sacheonensis]|uniref:Baseplate protein n=1 Tax=Paenibacillus sacheonensis TaxID=742054 RepID=A0A7X4YLJ0_9BACL|nr:GPW/gp25 family protein [Paenibacillus sacheonensis]MBM7568283.1 phage baseplate assembly protein W [Paenibacillus sacheonensis]NBC68530.1 baseplate protein [Paenibacillus sacheonensis]